MIASARRHRGAVSLAPLATLGVLTGWTRPRGCGTVGCGLRAGVACARRPTSSRPRLGVEFRIMDDRYQRPPRSAQDTVRRRPDDGRGGRVAPAMTPPPVRR